MTTPEFAFTILATTLAYFVVSLIGAWKSHWSLLLAIQYEPCTERNLIFKLAESSPGAITYEETAQGFLRDAFEIHGLEQVPQSIVE